MIKIAVDLFLLLPLVLWIGGIIMLSLIVVPTIFFTLPSRTQSSNLVAMIFHKMEILNFFVLGCLLISEVGKLYYYLPHPPLKEVLVTMLIGAFITDVLAAFLFVNYKVQGIRAQIISFDTSTPTEPIRRQFRYWHGILITVLMISVLLAASILVLRFIL
jgi:uncharacterized membrane protein